MNETCDISNNSNSNILIDSSDTNFNNAFVDIITMTVSTMMTTSQMDDILKDPETLFQYLMGTLFISGLLAKIWPCTNFSFNSKIKTDFASRTSDSANNQTDDCNRNETDTNNTNSNSSSSSTITSNEGASTDAKEKETENEGETKEENTSLNNQLNQLNPFIHLLFNKNKPREIQSLQRRFLPVFFLFRMSFWMSGPYFFQVYSSKIKDDPAEAKEFVCRVSLVGYLAIVLLGPFTGRFTEKYGRKTGTICAGLLYGIGSLSVFANTPVLLYVGRAIGSLASSWLCSAPESWLIGEFFTIQSRLQKSKKKKKDANANKNCNGNGKNDDGDDDDENDKNHCWLSDTFRLAYGGDAIVAIVAGQTASFAANHAGAPTGPFSLSPCFIIAALVVVLSFWAGNKTIAGDSESDRKHDKIAGEKSKAKHGEDVNDDKKGKGNDSEQCVTRTGLKMIFADRKILLLGLVQSLFEGSMYIFVVVWPPAISSAVRFFFGAEAITPFGTVFSCFMACAFLGSSICGKLGKDFSIDVKTTMTGLLLISTLSFLSAAYAIKTTNLFGVLAAFFAFETCVGMYFPSIAKLRSTVIPESHRPTIMTLFTVPLNVLVVGVVAFHPFIGDLGSIMIAGIAMGIAVFCMIPLRSILREEDRQRKINARKNVALLRGASCVLLALSRSRSNLALKDLDEDEKVVPKVTRRVRAERERVVRMERSLSFRGIC